ncbi:MAG: MotA/TolQ/ExbB proton channel family protein [Candidatus Methylomirabilales bacterium]
MYKHVSRLGRIAVIALPLLILPVGSWGAEKALPKASPPAQEGLVLSSRDTLLDLYFKGGVVMHLITLCSILALAVLFERLVNLRKKKIVSPQFLEEIRRHWYRREVQEAIAVCKTHDIALARIVRAGLLRFKLGSREIERAIQDAGRREATLLKKNLGLLAFLASMAPMLGLFGTVLGMIKSFDAIAVYGQGGNVGFVASGIAEALLTTAWGLMVGIPALGLYYYFRRKIELRVLEMEGVCVSFMEDLAIHQEGMAPPVLEREPILAAARPGVKGGRTPRPGGGWEGAPSFKPPS